MAAKTHLSRYNSAMVDATGRINELQAELSTNPSSRQFYQLGELLRREGRAREAAHVLLSGLAHHPRYVAAWVALGRAFLDTEAVTQAEGALEQALALDTQNPVAWRLLGETRLARGDRFAALDAMQHALDLAPGDQVIESAVQALAMQTAPPPEPPVAEVAPYSLVEEDTGGASPHPPHLEQFSLEAPFSDQHEVVEETAALPTEFFAQPGEESIADAFADVLAPEPDGRDTRGLHLAGDPFITNRVRVEAVDRLKESGRSRITTPPGPTAQDDGLTPTITLARLHIQQQDLVGAMDVLKRLIDREPHNQEALDLHELVGEMVTSTTSTLEDLTPVEKKIAALQRWLACFTLGRERASL